MPSATVSSTWTERVCFESLEVDEEEYQQSIKVNSISKGTLPPKEEKHWYRRVGEEVDHYPDGITNVLDLQDVRRRMVFQGGLHISPITDQHAPHYVLDISGRSGKWALDYADAYPNATVISSYQSSHRHTSSPSNCHFIKADPTQLVIWSCEDNHKFDFIHLTSLLTTLTDWPLFLSRAFNALSPGGHLELTEPSFPLSYVDDYSVKSNSPLFVWSKLTHLAARQLGLDTLINVKMEQLLTDAGFVNIQVQQALLPLGTWAQGKKEKEMGWLTMKNTARIMRPLAQTLWSEGLGWGEQQIDGFLTEAWKDLDSGGHYYWTVGVFSAQKPSTRSGHADV